METKVILDYVQRHNLKQVLEQMYGWVGNDPNSFEKAFEFLRLFQGKVICLYGVDSGYIRRFLEDKFEREIVFITIRDQDKLESIGNTIFDKNR